MRYRLLSCFILFVVTSSSGQDYFQQQVDHNIAITLNDELQEFEGEFEIIYQNNSTESLDFIYMHAWANAYSHKETEFARQEADHGMRKFNFSKPEAMGGYKRLSFAIDGTDLTYSNYEGHSDVLKLDLPKPLMPGAQVIISGTFLLDMPDAFSRLGKQKRSYQLTQWFPKPAVFDNEGWHPMPYLNMGEFYSEFGNYMVSVTCPRGFVVAATGQLQNEDEVAIYHEMAKSGQGYPDSQGNKTLTYIARNVHDFGLFLDRDFIVAHEVANVPSGRSVDCWGFYHPNSKTWPNSATYVKRTIEFVSEHVGEYPYPHASAVEGPIPAGGGMEYPMVTIIDPTDNARMLDEIIAHEVIHNWFYGIMASNERDHPWMDEGMTSYYESRYMRQFYGADGYQIPNVDKFIGKLPMERAILLLQSRRGREQGGHCGSREYNSINYFLANYGKPTMVLKYLESLYGKEEVDLAVQRYFKDWSFRHPQPEDIQASFEGHFQKDLDWLFLDMLQSNKRFDYAIDEVHDHSVEVENRGEINAPYFLLNDGADEKILVEGHSGEHESRFENKIDNNVIIDPAEMSPDIDRINNVRKKGKWLNGDPVVKLKFVPGVEEKSNSLFLYPAMGWNNYDGYMLGLHVSNMSLLPQRFVFQLNPMYGFRSDEWVGTVGTHYNWFFREGSIRKVQLGVEGRRFSISSDDELTFKNEMTRLSPFVVIDLRSRINNGTTNSFELRYDQVRTSEFDPIVGDGIDKVGLNYEFRRLGGIHPQHVSAGMEMGWYDYGVGDQYYLRTTLEYTAEWYYASKKKIRSRLFIGAFPMNDRRDAGAVNSSLAQRSLGLAYQGYHDYMDETFLGRREAEGFLSRQVAIQEGGFKTAFTAPFRSVLGNSNDLIASVNLSGDLPFNFWPINWIKPFVDIGYYSDKTPSSDLDLSEQILWSAGLSFSVFDGILALHFPLVNSDRINDVLDMAGQESVWERMTFSLDLNKVKLNKWIEDRPLIVN